MVSFSTQISDCDSDSPALSFSSDASICSTMAYHLLGNSDQVVGSVSIDFLSNSIGNALFHHELITILVLIGIVFVPGEVIFKFSASAAATEFGEWVQVGIDELMYIYIVLIVSVSSSLTHLYGFQLLVLML